MIVLPSSKQPIIKEDGTIDIQWYKILLALAEKVNDLEASVEILEGFHP